MATITKRSWKNKAGVVKTAWVVNYIDLNGKRHRQQFEKKKEAEGFRTEIEAQLNKGTFRQSSLTKTVADVAKGYLAGLENRLERDEISSSYVLSEQGYILNYISCSSGLLTEFSGIGGLKLRQCTTGVIKDHVRKLEAKGVTRNTRKRVVGTLSRIFNYAINEDEIASNPADRVAFAREPRDKRVTPPTVETFRRLLKFASVDLYVEIAFAGGTAVRISEQLALKWRDIDFDNAEVSITKSYNKRGQIRRTKTLAGLRTIPLSSELVAILKLHKKRSPFNGPDDPVFPNSDGHHKSYRNFIRDRFAPLLKRLREAGSAEGRDFGRLTWHALRHFGISSWINGGMLAKTVQTFAGHASIQTTMDRYGHLFPSQKHAAAMDKIGKDILKGAQMAHEVKMAC
ncbi:tyrosine-type recombinase/integrase [Rhizobium leguminosarum]